MKADLVGRRPVVAPAGHQHQLGLVQNCCVELSFERGNMLGHMVCLCIVHVAQSAELNGKAEPKLCQSAETGSGIVAAAFRRNSLGECARHSKRFHVRVLRFSQRAHHKMSRVSCENVPQTTFPCDAFMSSCTQMA